MAPRRIQLSRAKGWRLPPNTVKVDRSTKWGNPFRADKAPAEALAPGGPATAAQAYRWWLEGRAFHDKDTARRALILASLPELRGKNLACWCPPGAECHADVLLELANR
jgi:hypothetical protein